MALPAGRVIVLNGVGSVGKTSIAKAFQAASAEVWLHVQMDSFLDMLPERCMDDPEGLRFIRHPGPPPEVEIRTGAAISRLVAGMRAAVAGLARAGNNVILDDVLIDEDGSAHREALAGLDVFWVGLVAPLAVIEAREQARGDRAIGLARWQFPRVHKHMTYDLVVDAAESSPADIARLICVSLGA